MAGGLHGSLDVVPSRSCRLVRRPTEAPTGAFDSLLRAHAGPPAGVPGGPAVGSLCQLAGDTACSSMAPIRSCRGSFRR